MNYFRFIHDSLFINSLLVEVKLSHTNVFCICTVSMTAKPLCHKHTSLLINLISGQKLTTLPQSLGAVYQQHVQVAHIGLPCVREMENSSEGLQLVC